MVHCYQYLVLICVTRSCNVPGMLRRDISRRFIIIIIIIIIVIIIRPTASSDIRRVWARAREMIWQVRACQSDDNRQPIVGLRHPPPPPQSRQSPRNDVTSARPAAASIGFATREPANWIIEHYQRERERERESRCLVFHKRRHAPTCVVSVHDISNFDNIPRCKLSPAGAALRYEVKTSFYSTDCKRPHRCCPLVLCATINISLLSMSLTARLGKFSILGHKKLLTRA